jgi:hypothetical protein
MSAYASVSRVKTILESELEPDLTIFDALNLTASNELDAACGVGGFGTEPLPRTLTFGSHYPYPSGVTPYGYPRVVLDPPVLTASTVAVETVALDPTAYRLLWPSFDRYGGIALTSSPWWNGEVTITGDFADLPPGPVPPEIVEAASLLVAGYLRRDRMPAGEVSGSEGLTFRPSNPWSDERVKRAVARFRLPSLAV